MKLQPIKERCACLWVAFALRATGAMRKAFAFHRRTECEGYPRRKTPPLGTAAATKGLPAPPEPAFTLIELLVVIVIIAIMAFLAAGSIRGISGGTDMTRASEDVAGVVTLAAQRAAAFNRQTSIRFLAPGSASPYVAYQFWEQANSQDPTSWQPVLPIQRLPADIVITNNTTFSTLFSRSNITGTMTDPTGTVWNYAQAYFAPDGSLVATTGQTSITLIAANTPAGVSGLITGLPPNFAVVDIEPLHSISVIYRPQ